MRYVDRLTQLLYAAHAGCSEEVLTIAAMTSVASPFTAFEYGPSMDVQAEIARRKFVAEEGDHLTLLNVYNAFVHPRIGQQSPKWAAKYSLSYASLPGHAHTLDIAATPRDEAPADEKAVQVVRRPLAAVALVHRLRPLLRPRDTARFVLAASLSLLFGGSVLSVLLAVQLAAPP